MDEKQNEGRYNLMRVLNQVYEKEKNIFSDFLKDSFKSFIENIGDKCVFNC